MKKYSSAVLALILTSTCMTASAATQEISKKPMSVMETRQWRLSISTPLPETPMQ